MAAVVIAVVGTGALVSVALATGQLQLGGGARAGSSDFLPFVAVYEVTFEDGNQVVERLEYESRRAWKYETIADPDDGGNVGSYKQAVGDDLIVYSARLDDSSTVQGRGRWVPGPWLLTAAELRRQPGTVTRDEIVGETVAVTVARELSCAATPSTEPTTAEPSSGQASDEAAADVGGGDDAAVQLPSCATGEATYVYERHYTFDRRTGGPLLIEERVDGELAVRRVAREFRPVQ